MEAAAKSKVNYEIEATVIRADGTIEELGVIASTRWKKLDPRRLASERRIRAANRRNEEKS